MDKEIILDSIGQKSTGAIVLTSEYKEFDCIIEIKASVSDNTLFRGEYTRPVFADKMDEFLKSNDIVFFVVSGIDKASIAEQRRFIPIVKDRVFKGYRLPKNVIIIFTVDSEETIKNIDNELYSFLDVAI